MIELIKPDKLNLESMETPIINEGDCRDQFHSEAESRYLNREMVLFCEQL